MVSDLFLQECPETNFLFLMSHIPLSEDKKEKKGRKEGGKEGRKEAKIRAKAKESTQRHFKTC